MGFRYGAWVAARGGPVPRTEIDIPAVVAVGAAVERIASGMDDASAEIEGWAYQGQRAVRESGLCRGTMISAAHDWAGEIRELAASVRQYGADLRTTAESYAAYDRMSAQELRQSGGTDQGPITDR